MDDVKYERKVMGIDYSPEYLERFFRKQVHDKLHTDDPNIIKIVQVVGERELSVKGIMDGIGLPSKVSADGEGVGIV